MNKNLSILICCASGSGTSMLIKLNVEKVCKSLGLPCKVEHSPISEGKARASKYDVVITTLNFVKMFDHAKKAGTAVIGVQNPMSLDEIKQGLIDAGVAE